MRSDYWCQIRYSQKGPYSMVMSEDAKHMFCNVLEEGKKDKKVLKVHIHRGRISVVF